VSPKLSPAVPDVVVTDGKLRGSARYVDRILKGADPASLPVEEPSEFVLGINLDRKVLGLTVPPGLAGAGHAGRRVSCSTKSVQGQTRK
jgi:hypothetical protein